jgi:hypothetical protein
MPRGADFGVAGAAVAGSTFGAGSIIINLEEPIEVYPAQPEFIRPSVRACRLSIAREMAQAQQIRSTILQNHESKS